MYFLWPQVEASLSVFEGTLFLLKTIFEKALITIKKTTISSKSCAFYKCLFENIHLVVQLDNVLVMRRYRNTCNIVYGDDDDDNDSGGGDGDNDGGGDDHDDDDDDDDDDVGVWQQHTLLSLAT